jgi:sugar O-acyltransferase (sialic acid O-acetyltransferase NeuD family)
MKKTDIVLVGGGGHAKVVYGTLLNLGTWNIIGYTDIEDRKIPGLKYLGTDEELQDLFEKVKNAAVTVGHMKSYELRSVLYKKLKGIGFSLPAITAKSAVVMQNVSVGEGTYIGEQAYVGPDVRIGVMCIVNTAAVVEHESEIGDFVHVSINTTLAGNTKVGNGSFVGMGSCVVNGVSIGKNVIIAAGTVVRKQIREGSLVHGNPGKIITNYRQRAHTGLVSQ